MFIKFPSSFPRLMIVIMHGFKSVNPVIFYYYILYWLFFILSMLVISIYKFLLTT